MSHYGTNPNLNQDLDSNPVNLELIPANTLSINLQSQFFNLLTSQKPGTQGKAFKYNIVSYQAKAKTTFIKKICNFININNPNIKYNNNFKLNFKDIMIDFQIEYINSPEFIKINLNVDHYNTYPTFKSNAITNQKIKINFDTSISNPNYKENKVNPNYAANKRKNNLRINFEILVEVN